MAISAKDVQALRRATGAGMMDAKRALEETGNDPDAAARWLREKGLAQSAKRADRANQQGSVAVASTGSAAAVVELRCETDYVARSPEFTALVDQLAADVAERGEQGIEDHRAAIDDVRISLKENVQLGRVVRFEAGEDSVLDSYLHIQSERGVNGVLVELVGGDRALAHDVALHVASMRPEWLSRHEVPADRVAAEREVLETLTRNEGKPEQAIPKIVEGRLNGFFRDRCLLEQPFVKDPKQSVAEHLGGATVRRFAQVEIGR